MNQERFSLVVTLAFAVSFGPACHRRATANPAAEPPCREGSFTAGVACADDD